MGSAAPPVIPPWHGSGTQTRVSKRLERQAMLLRLGEARPPSLERMFQFISQSAMLAGTHTRDGQGPETTVGIRVQGTIVEEILPWGPAHLSERISIRDELLAVDGAPVNADTLPEMIISTDICNTYVDLDLKTADGSGRKTVRLVRVSRAHLRVAEDLFETLIKLKGQLAKLFPECVGHIDRALECISALAISEFDAREAFVERLMDEGVQQYLVDLHSYIDHLEDENGHLHADIKLALGQVQEHHMKGLSLSQMQEQVQVMHEEILRLQQSEALLARQLDEMRRSNADQMEQDLMRKDEEIEQLKKITNDVRQENMALTLRLAAKEGLIRERDQHVDELLAQKERLQGQVKDGYVEREKVVQEGFDSLAAMESEIKALRESREELRLELDLKNSRLEDLEMEIHELKCGRLQDRQHIEKSDDFVAKLQGQLAAQKLRIDGLHERLIAERDRASILEAQRRQLIEELGNGKGPEYQRLDRPLKEGDFRGNVRGSPSVSHFGSVDGDFRGNIARTSSDVSSKIRGSPPVPHFGSVSMNGADSMNGVDAEEGRGSAQVTGAGRGAFAGRDLPSQGRVEVDGLSSQIELVKSKMQELHLNTNSRRNKAATPSTEWQQLRPNC